jgi:hypothetical protein
VTWVHADVCQGQQRHCSLDAAIPDIAPQFVKELDIFRQGCAFRGSWALISRDGGQRIRAKVGRVSLTDVGY